LPAQTDYNNGNSIDEMMKDQNQENTPQPYNLEVYEGMPYLGEKVTSDIDSPEKARVEEPSLVG